MNQSSDERLAIARTAHSALLRKLQSEITQTDVAKVIGVNKSTISRLVNEHAEHVLAILALTGMKFVDADARIVTPAELAALRLLAERGLQTYGPEDKADK